jgi:hypothetical protein
MPPSPFTKIYPCLAPLLLLWSVLSTVRSISVQTVQYAAVQYTSAYCQYSIRQILLWAVQYGLFVLSVRTDCTVKPGYKDTLGTAGYILICQVSL